MEFECCPGKIRQSNTSASPSHSRRGRRPLLKTNSSGAFLGSQRRPSLPRFCLGSRLPALSRSCERATPHADVRSRFRYRLSPCNFSSHTDFGRLHRRSDQYPLLRDSSRVADRAKRQRAACENSLSCRLDYLFFSDVRIAPTALLGFSHSCGRSGTRPGCARLRDPFSRERKEQSSCRLHSSCGPCFLGEANDGASFFGHSSLGRSHIWRRTIPKVFLLFNPDRARGLLSLHRNVSSARYYFEYVHHSVAPTLEFPGRG